MKTPALVLALLLSDPSMAADNPQPLTIAHEMAAACARIPTIETNSQTPREDAYAMLCIGYMAGWIAAANFSSNKTCLPPDLTTDRAVAIFQSALALSPQFSNSHTGILLSSALQSAFPCPAKKP